MTTFIYIWFLLGFVTRMRTRVNLLSMSSIQEVYKEHIESTKKVMLIDLSDKTKLFLGKLLAVIKLVVNAWILHYLYHLWIN